MSREEADRIAAEAEAAFLRGDVVRARDCAREAGVLYSAHASLPATGSAEDTEAWLAPLYEGGRSEWARGRALSVIYDTIDDMLLASRFADVDRILTRVDVGRLDITLALGFLSITLAASTRLAARAALVARVEARVRELAPDRVDALMDGLGDAP